MKARLPENATERRMETAIILGSTEKVYEVFVFPDSFRFPFEWVHHFMDDDQVHRRADQCD